MPNIQEDTKRMLTNISKNISIHINHFQKELLDLEKEISKSKTEEKIQQVRGEIKNTN